MGGGGDQRKEAAGVDKGSRDDQRGGGRRREDIWLDPVTPSLIILRFVTDRREEKAAATGGRMWR